MLFGRIPLPGLRSLPSREMYRSYVLQVLSPMQVFRVHVSIKGANHHCLRVWSPLAYVVAWGDSDNTNTGAEG